MRTLSLRRVLVAGAAALGFSLSLAVAPPAQAAVTAEYIVTIGGNGPVGDLLDDLLARVGAGEILDTYEHALRGGLVRLPVALGDTLALLPGVLGVERNGVMTLSVDQANPPSYGLDRIDQRNRPLNNVYSYTQTGAGVTAYIIDTGIRGSHQDFGGRAVAGVNTVNGETSLEDCNGHGTHVAGTVGGTRYGVAKGVTLVSVRVFGCANTTPTSEIIEGVDWATAHHQPGQPAVANMSLGGGASAALDNAVQGLINDGVTVAIASGNDGANGCSGSPARVSAGIVTGATDSNDARASFSNYGSCVDVHAPGVSINSAGRSSDTAQATLSGTSMATPHVAGAAALVLGANPGASPSAVHTQIVSSATTGVITGIRTSCNLLDNLLGTCMKGTPNRLLYTGPYTAPPPPPPPPPCEPLLRLLGLC